MVDLNIDAETLAKYIGVSPSTISRYLSGEITNVRRDKIKKLSDALLIDVSYLMGWEEYTGNPISGVSSSLSNIVPVYNTINDISDFRKSDNHITDIEVPKKYKRKKELFGLKINSDTVDKVIPVGAIAVLQKCDVVKQGDLTAIILDNNDAIIYRYYKLRDGCLLEPDSLNVENVPIIVKDSSEHTVKIVGKVIWYCMDIEE